MREERRESDLIDVQPHLGAAFGSFRLINPRLSLRLSTTLSAEYRLAPMSMAVHVARRREVSRISTGPRDETTEEPHTKRGASRGRRRRKLDRQPYSRRRRRSRAPDLLLSRLLRAFIS